ncbi:MAG: hypothetical protein ABR564_05705 [Candidatus Dormibacteria bacterium]
MDLTDELRRQARRYRCAACNQNMAECDIRVLERQESVALIQVTCASCKEESLFQIVFRTTDAPQKPRAATIEGAPEMAEPISSDELLDVHLALSRHGGSLKDLLPTP